MSQLHVCDEGSQLLFNQNRMRIHFPSPYMIICQCRVRRAGMTPKCDDLSQCTVEMTSDSLNAFQREDV